MNAHPHDQDGVPAVYVLHFEPAYHHAATTSAGRATSTPAWPSTSPGAARRSCAPRWPPASHVELVATIAGSRHLERRLKRWHKTGQLCPRCRAARGGTTR